MFAKAIIYESVWQEEYLGDNNAVNTNFRGVCEYIDEYVKEHTAEESPIQLR